MAVILEGAAAATAMVPLVAQSIGLSAHADVPSAEQVMANAVKAMGGKDAINNIQTLRALLETQIDGPQGKMKIEMESLWSRKGGRLTRAKTPMGDMEMGTDGKTSWMKSPMGYGPLTGQQADALKDQSGMFINMLEPERTAKEEIAKLENAGVEKFADTECYRLHYTNKEGKEGDLYYSVDTGLPVGFQRTEASATTKMVLSDWKETSGVQVFRKINSSAANQPAMTITVTEVEINKVDDSAFAVPEEAKKALGGATSGETAPEPGKPTSGAAPATGGSEIRLEDLTPEQQTIAKRMAESLKSGGDVAKMKEAVARIEPTLGMISDPAKRKPIEYAIQEVKKEIAKLGG
jgi:hypothetical protein